MTMATKLGRAVLYNEELPSIKSQKSLYHVVLQGHVTNQVRCISTTTRPVVIKLDKLMSYCRGLPPIKSNNLLNLRDLMRSCDKSKTFYLL